MGEESEAQAGREIEITPERLAYETDVAAFLVIMVAFVIATALVPFLRNVTPKAAPPDAH